MKIRLLFFALFFGALNYFNSQVLKDTKWSATLNIPAPVFVIFEYSDSKVEMFVDDMVLESMSYTLKGDILFFKKISGGSPCHVSTDEGGTYKFRIDGDKMKLELISDKCDARSMSIKNAEFTRIKD